MAVKLGLFSNPKRAIYGECSKYLLDDFDLIHEMVARVDIMKARKM